jgi:hypothetical protein
MGGGEGIATKAPESDAAVQDAPPPEDGPARTEPAHTEPTMGVSTLLYRHLT